MNIFGVLKQEHEKIEELYYKLLENSVEDKKVLIQEFVNTLKKHTQFEEENIYPLLKNQKKYGDNFYTAVEEHQVVDNLLQEISSSNLQQPEILAKLKVLEEILYSHVVEEEAELFPLIRKNLSNRQLNELARLHGEGKE